MLKNLFVYNRPISPHLIVYSPQISSLFSIWHRITGVVLASFLCLSIFILKVFTIIDWTLLNIINNLVLNFTELFSLNSYLYLTICIIFLYHIFNGIRHILWDIGFLLNLRILVYSSLTLMIFLIVFILKFLI